MVTARKKAFAPKIDRSAKELTGTVEGIVYQNKLNDYTVINLATDEGELVTAVGEMPYVGEGERVRLFGEWTRHNEYGEQFSVSVVEKLLPTGANEILKYLSGKNVRGIGPVTALKIVNRFGDDTFDVIEQHPEWLSDIPGISRKKAAEISESFREQAGIRELMVFCRNYIGSTLISHIYEKWGSRAVSVIRENPYVLCEETDSVGFDRADAIARNLGFPADAPERLSAGLTYLLRYNASVNGHVCLPLDRLVDAAAEELGAPADLIRETITKEIGSGRLSSYRIDGTEYVFTSAYGEDEDVVARRMVALDRSAPEVSLDNVDRLIDRAESEFSIRYSRDQREAIFEAFRRGVMIVTGGPGTGKTTLIRALLRIFGMLGFRCALAAPTGRAAKKMSEATQEEAKTIHRMLEMEKVSDLRPRFNRNENNPLDENVIVIDEASMIDLPLMAALLRAIRIGSRLILIGDSGQLPSVGCGNVLADLISSRAFATVCLNQIFRQEKGSLIISNAHLIHAGELPKLSREASDFFFLHRPDEDDIPGTVVDLISKRLPRTYTAAIREQIQVITPSRRGKAGTIQLNALLQNCLNPAAKKKKEFRFRDLVFREGDKVMQIKNNYETEWEKDGIAGIGVFNGDIGVIREIDLQNEEMTIDFDGRISHYRREQFEELEHAYAITVHKSQGSEYPVVLMPVYYCGTMLQSRNLLYTAVTRAKKMVILVGRADILEFMVKNNRQEVRYTCLFDRLRHAHVSGVVSTL
ncbi:MAG: ATP-dependent RecD-like DNA helicase [Clostridia bacterium]|nr:ATP-dependent RecD-like DNA helicase [Clostridia bacterium]MBR5043942.1 ATP-dependent RecD-like DNA helicase [Clostridia bacterium]